MHEHEGTAEVQRHEAPSGDGSFCEPEAAPGARMSRARYEREKRRLQIDLLKWQAWVKETGQRVVILFEGRDAAGKGRSDQAFHGAPQSARRARGRAGKAQ